MTALEVLRHIASDKTMSGLYKKARRDREKLAKKTEELRKKLEAAEKITTRLQEANGKAVKTQSAVRGN